MLVSIGSTNPTKVNAVRNALQIIGLDYNLASVSVDSGVSNQPFCDETFVGARNRAIRSLLKTNADLGIGIEGGICVERNTLVAFAVVYAIDNNGKENFAKSASFTLPTRIAELIYKGIELGSATDLAFSTIDSKHKSGAVGILTKYIDRTRLYVDPVIMALYPFYNSID
jgi:inosine/xanthosine triphosphatase